MAKLDSLIICEDIQNIIALSEKNLEKETSPRPQIIGPMDTIAPYSVPGNYSFALFGVISQLDNNFDNRFRISIDDPDGDVLFKSNETNIPKQTDNISTMKFSFNFRNFLFLKNGTHTLRVYINNIEIDNRPISVQSKN